MAKNQDAKLQIEIDVKEAEKELARLEKQYANLTKQIQVAKGATEAHRNSINALNRSVKTSNDNINAGLQVQKSLNDELAKQKNRVAELQAVSRKDKTAEQVKEQNNLQAAIQETSAKITANKNAIKAEQTIYNSAVKSKGAEEVKFQKALANENAIIGKQTAVQQQIETKKAFIEAQKQAIEKQKEEAAITAYRNKLAQAGSESATEQAYQAQKYAEEVNKQKVAEEASITASRNSAYAKKAEAEASAKATQQTTADAQKTASANVNNAKSVKEMTDELRNMVDKIPSSTKSSSKSVEEMGSAIDSVKVKTTEWGQGLKDLADEQSELGKTQEIKDLAKELSKEIEWVRVYETAVQKAASAWNELTSISTKGMSATEKLAHTEDVNKAKADYLKYRDSLKVSKAEVERMTNSLERMNEQFDKGITNPLEKTEPAKLMDDKQTSILNKAQLLLAQIDNWQKKNSGSAREYNDKLEELKSSLSDQSLTGEQLKHAGEEFRILKEQAKSATAETQGGFSGIKSIVGSLIGVTNSFAKSIIKSVNPVKMLKLGFNSLMSPVNAVGSALGGFVKGLKRAAVQGLIFRPMRAGLSKVTEGFVNALYANNQFSSAMNNLAGTVYTALAPAFNALVPIIATVINYVATLITYISTLFNAIFGLKKATKQQASAFGAAASGADKTAKSTKKAGKAADKAKTQFASWDTIQQLAQKDSSGGGSPSGAGGAGGSMPTFDQDFSGAENALSGIIDMIKNGDWYGLGRELANYLGTIIETANKWITEKFTPFCAEFGKDLAQFINGMIDGAFGQTAQGQVGYLIGNFFNAINEGLNSFVHELNFAGIGRYIALQINTFFEAFDFKKFGDTVGTFVTGMFDLFASAIKDLDAKKIVSSIYDFFAGIDYGELARSVANYLSQAFIKAIQFVSEGLGQLDFKKIIDTIVDAIVGFAKGIDWAGLAEALGNFVANAIKALANLGQAMIDAVSEAITAIFDYFSEYVEKHKEDGESTGEAILNGVLEGIKDAVSKVGEWIKTNLFDPFMKGVKEAFGIASPAKEMKPIGGYIIEGMLEGITKGLSKIKSWVQEHILDKIQGAINGGKEIVATIGGKVGDTFTKMKAKWDSIQDTTKRLMAEAKEKALTTIKEKWDSIKDKTRTLEAEAKDKSKGVLDKIKTIWEKINPKTATLTTKQGGTKLSVFDKLKKLWDGIHDKRVTLTTNYSKGATPPPRADGGMYRNGKWTPIEQYASGGTPNQGQMFIAREAGPELVGSIGRGTAVMNNNQIVASVSSGVAKAVASVLSDMIRYLQQPMAITVPSTGLMVNPSTEFVNILSSIQPQEINMQGIENAMLNAIKASGLTNKNGDIILQVDGNTFARVINPYLSNNNRRLGLTIY